MRRRPKGSAVTSPSACCQLRVESWHRCLRAMDWRVSVSLSSSSLLSARCTSVTTANIIRWSRVVRSSSISRVSLRCCSRSYGTTAEKLLLLFCRRCQLVTLVSTPSSRFCISRTASSVGTGITSMDSMSVRFSSVNSLIMESLM